MKFLVLYILFFSAFPLAFFQISSAEEIPDGFVFHKVKIGDTLSRIAPPEYLEEAKKSERAVYVFLDKQYFGAYQNGRLAFWGPISSGIKERTTPKGNFKVLWKSRFYYSKKYDADMPFAVNISSNGYFLHAQSLPGRPASHGYIRLLRVDAKKYSTGSQKTIR
ncbi:MAG: hypothetical protein A3J63_04095 [Candidatus Moranbacteria bacterium RIFCSPHIGHO2_02_FULL_40_12b]|nr:MAG: hypothetical protein A3J63_04095 [Candidatus Moranbacteria bacterium RIFCSPHIGHO2_02_FULL_40_12b]